MASPTRWTWIWVNVGSWWWTERPGVLRFMGSQRVRHNWATELNWTECQFQDLFFSGKPKKRYHLHCRHSQPVKNLPAIWETWVQSLAWKDPLEKGKAQFSSAQSLSCVWLFATPWIAARQASLSITISRGSLKLTSTESNCGRPRVEETPCSLQHCLQ